VIGFSDNDYEGIS